MMNPISIGLAMAVTASLGFAHGEGTGTNGDEKTPATGNLWQDGVKVSYKPGGGITIASDGEKKDFSLNMSGRIQVRWFLTQTEGVGNAPDTTASSFALRRARTKFSGFVFNEDITYTLQMEHTAATDVLDAWADWRFVNNADNEIGVRVGLQKFRAGLQSDNSSGALEFAERSIATQTFANKRGAGALVHGGLMKGDNGNKLQWHVGMLNGDTAGGTPGAAAAANTDSEFMYTLGVLFAAEGLKGGSEGHVEGDLEHNGKFEPVVGVNYAIGTTDAANTNQTSTVNAFASLKTGSGIAAQGEYFMRTDEPRFNGASADSSGWYAQASFTTKPGEGTQWGFALRASQVKFDDAGVIPAAIPSLAGTGPFAGGTGEINEYSAGINAYYHKHKLKTQLNGVMQELKPDGGTETTNNGLDLLFTLFF